MSAAVFRVNKIAARQRTGQAFCPMTFPPELIRKLATARHIAVLTGAGISAESGVPTFRDAQTGLWARFSAEDLATPEAFRRNPKLVWEWYAWRRELVAQAKPNPGHLALAELASLFSEFTLITQNVDGLHQRAGSRDVIELHGNIMRTKCFTDEKLVTEWNHDDVVPPQCPRCGANLRPDVVWFGEILPQSELASAFAASRACEVFLAIGTSALVYPAAALPYEALESDAVVVEVNPRATQLSEKAHFVLKGAAGVLLPELLALVRQAQQVDRT